MRSWRKLHSNLLFSERAPLLSDSAMTLFCLLVVVQDDEGYYPWTPQAVRSFTISRPWSFEQTTELAKELVAAGMAFWDEDSKGIVLHRGEELNGLPRKYRAVLTYRNRPVDTNETPPDALGTEADRRLPLADRLLPSDKDPDRDKDKDEEIDREAETEESYIDLPIHPKGDILGLFLPQELEDLRVSHPLLNLEVEAEKCLAWYRGKREHIRDSRAAFTRWLERARAPTGARPPPKANRSRLPRDEPLWEKPHLAASPEAEALWDKCKEVLKDRVTPTIFATWLAGTHGYACEGDVLWVEAETPFTAEWLDRYAAGHCEKALRDVGRPNAELRIFAEPSVDSPHFENTDTGSSGAAAKS